MIGRALRHEALRVLSKRLAALAARYGFSYTRVTVRDMRTRWGSCSSERRISLALSLMTLPEHLIDYVLLHELCHTVEINHQIKVPGNSSVRQHLGHGAPLLRLPLNFGA